MRNIILVLAYVLTAVMAIRTALIIVQDEVASCGWMRVLLYMFAIVVMNAEFWLVKLIVMRCTGSEAVELQGLHEHPLEWATMTGYVNCTVCSLKIGPRTGGFLALRCSTCVPSDWGRGGFTMCANCYRKFESKASIQGGDLSLLRGDKGLKQLPPMTPGKFVTRILTLMRPFWSTVALALICVFAGQICSTYTPKVQGDVLNALMKGDEEAFSEKVVLFIGLIVTSTMMSVLQSYSIAVVIQRLYNHTASTLYRSLLQQDMAFYDNAMSGRLTSRLTNDLMQAINPIPTLVNSILANIVTLVTGLAVCLSTSWRLTVLAFVFLAPVVYINGLYNRWARGKQAQRFTYIADANSCATQALGNIRTVMFSGAEKYEQDRHAKHLKDMLSNALVAARGQAGNVFMSNALQQGASVLVLFYGGRLSLEKSGFEAGSIWTFILLWNRLSSAFQSLNQNINEPVKSMSAAQRVFEIIDLEPDICKDAHVGARLPEDVGLQVRFEDVVFGYQSRPDDLAFDGVNFTAEAGETTAVVGKSGCGKSTLTRLLLRFYDPHEGRILINNQPLTNLSLPAHRQSIGYVSQDTQLFHATIRDNLTYGLPDGDYTRSPLKEAVELACHMAKAEEFILELPEGYSTMLGEGGQDLSGGQRQRISIARALMRKPRLFLLDEATSALDTENEALVQESLSEVMQEMKGRCTIIVIAHRLATVVDAQKIVVLEKGKVVEVGTHSELVAQDGPYKALVQRQIQTDDTKPESTKASDDSSEERSEGKGKGKGKGKQWKRGGSRD